MPVGGSEAADGLRGYWREAAMGRGPPSLLQKGAIGCPAFERQVTGA